MHPNRHLGWNLKTACVALFVSLFALGGCPSEPYVPEPVGPGVRPEDHPFFPIDGDVVHAMGAQAISGAIACNSCHTQENDFSFSCIDCHEHRASGIDPDGSVGMDIVHRGKSRYRYDSQTCLSCHPNGLSDAMPRGEHDSYFPIDEATVHGDIRCGECHLDDEDRQRVTCTGCHRDDDGDGHGAHGHLPMLQSHGAAMADMGYAWTTQKCLDCHARSQNPGLLEHTPFPIAEGQLHHEVACASCHASRQDRSELACIGCHTQTDDGAGPRDIHGAERMFELHENGGVPGYDHASGSCYACHRNAQVPGDLDHESLYPIGPGTTHELGAWIDDDPNDGFPAEQVACISCHQSPRNAEFTCLGCHAHAEEVLSPTHENFPDYEWTSEACLFCHDGGLRIIDHTFFPVEATDVHFLDDPRTLMQDGMLCSECHTSQTNRSLLNCTTCHEHEADASYQDHGPEMENLGYSFDSGACFDCHRQSQVPGAIDHEPAFPLLPPSGNGAHESLACGACHGDKLRRLDSLTCTACHQPTSDTDARDVHGEPRLDDVHGGLPEYIWSPQSCIGCHADGTADGARQNLDHIWFPVAAGDTHALQAAGGDVTCSDCHLSSSDYTIDSIGCTQCHLQVNDNGQDREAHGEPRLAEIHERVDGYAWISNICLECHPNAEPDGLFEHDRFPIGEGQAHDTVLCTECHTPGIDKTDPAGLKCATCHQEVTENPSIEQIHARIPDYGPTSPDCYRCHPRSEPVGTINHEPFFPIAAGTPHGTSSCAECHIDTNDRRVVTCTGCHRDENGDGAFDHDLPPMQAVHGDGMAGMGYSWTTTACRTCHPNAEDPGLLDHSAAFPIQDGTVHASVACASCHASRAERAELTCIGCHTQVDDGAGARAVHGADRMFELHGDGSVPGYGHDSQACYPCHRQAQVPGNIEHDALFPIGPGSTHELGASIDNPAVTVECVTCHADPNNQANVTCTNCHSHEAAQLEPSHNAFPDYAHESSACVFCHRGGATLLEHPFFPVDAGDVHARDNPTTVDVDGLLCRDCHSSQTNRSQLSCTSCHEVSDTATQHGTSLSRAGYVYDSQACFACHQTAQVPGLIDHEPLYPLLPPSGAGAHQSLTCVDCHTNRADRAGSLACTTCHQPTSPTDARDVHGQARLAEVHNGMPGYVFSSQSCTGCHTDGTAAAATENFDHIWFPVDAGKTHALVSAGGQLNCADCHVTPGDYSINGLDCRACHQQVNDGTGNRDVHGQPRMDDIHSNVGGYSWTTRACLDCHPNGESTGAIAHDDFPIGTGAAHAGIGCDDCHGPDRSNVGQLKCATCHATETTNPNITQIHAGIPGFANNSTACLQCHANANPTGSMDHQAYFPISANTPHGSASYFNLLTSNQNSCSACHASRTDRASALCATCHASVPPVPSGAHGRVRGFRNDSTSCKLCHAEGDVFDLARHTAFNYRHEGANCVECHRQRRTDKPWAVNWNFADCRECHNANCTVQNQGPCD